MKSRRNWARAPWARRSWARIPRSTAWLRSRRCASTTTGTVMGTPSYMSPEQLAGKKVDGRSDLFSLGATLYEMLTGEQPFTGDTVATLLFKIANERHESPRIHKSDLPEPVEKVVDKA